MMLIGGDDGTDVVGTDVVDVELVDATVVVGVEVEVAIPVSCVGAGVASGDPGAADPHPPTTITAKRATDRIDTRGTPQA
jgi:hypothetical protein